MLWSRGLDGGRRRARAPADVLPVRSADVRSRQARTAMGPGDVGRATGTRMPDVPGGQTGLGYTARPVRVLWRYPAFCDARTGRLPRVRPRPRRTGRARVDGRLAQRESASLTRKRSGVRVPQRPQRSLCRRWGGGRLHLGMAGVQPTPGGIGMTCDYDFGERRRVWLDAFPLRSSVRCVTTWMRPRR
jgi:hypothetical protein